MQDLGKHIGVLKGEQVIAVVPENWRGTRLVWVYIYKPRDHTLRYESLQWDEMSDKARSLFHTGVTLTNELLSSVRFDKTADI